jgi:very-short-patch-repair endonuclease
MPGPPVAGADGAVPEPMRPALAIVRLGADTDGIFTASNIGKAGLSRKVLHRLTAEGLLTREMQGFYRVGHGPATKVQRRRLAAMATGGTISHWSAAAYWGLDLRPDGPVHVTLPRATYRRREIDWIVVHRVQTDIEPRRVVRYGMSVIKPTETMLDLASGGASAAELRSFLDHCLSKRYFRWLAWEKFLSGLPAGTKGRLILELLSKEAAGVDSVAEAELVRLLRRAGYKPVTGYPVHEDDGTWVARLDVALPTQRVGIEMDSLQHHSGSAAFVRDRQRHNRVSALGWLLLHTTPVEIRSEPDRFLRDLAATVELRFRQGRRSEA